MSKSNRKSNNWGDDDDSNILHNSTSTNNKAPSLLGSGFNRNREQLEQKVASRKASGGIASKYQKGPKKIQNGPDGGEWIVQGTKQGKAAPKNRKHNNDNHGSKLKSQNQITKYISSEKEKHLTNNDDYNRVNGRGQLHIHKAGIDGNQGYNNQHSKKNGNKYGQIKNKSRPVSRTYEQESDSDFDFQDQQSNPRRYTTGNLKLSFLDNSTDIDSAYQDTSYTRIPQTRGKSKRKNQQQEVVDLVDSEEEDLKTPTNDNEFRSSSSITTQKVLTSSLWESKAEKMEEGAKTQNHAFQNMQFAALGLFFGTKRICSHREKKSFYRIQLNSTEENFTISKDHKSIQPLDAIISDHEKVVINFHSVREIYICFENFPTPFMAFWVDQNVDLNSVAIMNVDLKPESENTFDDPSKYILVLTSHECVDKFFQAVKTCTDVSIHDVSEDKNRMYNMSMVAFRDGEVRNGYSSGIRKSSRNRRRTTNSIYLDGDVFDPTDRETILIYPMEEEAVDAVTVTRGDQKRCRDGEYWNDNLIDLRIKLLLEEMPDISSKKIHVFSCHFFSVLSDNNGAHNSVKRWTKNIDVFELDYIFIPINANNHWSLAVIIRPGLLIKHLEKAKHLKKRSTSLEDSDGEGQSNRGATRLNYYKDKTHIYKNLSINENENLSCVIHLDSLGMHNSTKINRMLSNYLDSEWSSRKKNDTENNTTYIPNCDGLNINKLFTSAGIHTIKVTRVPRQENGWDCGVFVTEYVKMLLYNNPTSNTEDVRNKFSDHVEARFNQSEIQKVRTNMKSRIDSLASQYKQELEHRKIEERRKKEDMKKEAEAAGAVTATTTPGADTDASETVPLPSEKNNDISVSSAPEKGRVIEETREDPIEEFQSQATAPQNEYPNEIDDEQTNLKINGTDMEVDQDDDDNEDDVEKDSKEEHPQIFNYKSSPKKSELNSL